jgi:hypothetical protein
LLLICRAELCKSRAKRAVERGVRVGHKKSSM